MTFYLGITTSKMIKLPGRSKERGEFAVERQLREMGLQAWAPRRIDFKRQGKKRYAEAIESPYLPNYIFAEIPAQAFYEAVGCKGLSKTLMAISGPEIASVRHFIEEVEAEEAKARRIIEANDRAAMCQFNPGQPLQLLSGPFTERAVKFKRMVQGDMMPMVEYEFELFGKKGTGRIDPLDVRAAETS